MYNRSVLANDALEDFDFGGTSLDLLDGLKSLLQARQCFIQVRLLCGEVRFGLVLEFLSFFFEMLLNFLFIFIPRLAIPFVVD